MFHIIILGGTGYTGRLIARYLLEYTDTTVTLAARHLDRVIEFAEDLNREYPGSRVATVYADAANTVSLQSAFRGHDLAIVASPTTAHTETVARSALAAGVDYLDVQLSTAKLSVLQSLAPQIEHAGRCFITEAGFHPGLPAALVRFAAAHFDQLENAITAAYLNMGKDLPYTEAVDELIEAFKNYQAQVYSNGKWTKPGSYKLRKIDFGSDIGNKLCYSMFFEELRLLPEIFPTLREVGFYISETHWITDWLIMPVAWIWLKLAPNAARPIGKFLWWGMGNFHNPPYRVELQVQANGSKDGKRIALRTSVAHADGYVLTAVPVVAALLQILDGSARKPGLWMMGHLVHPGRLLEDMEKMGVQIKTETVNREAGSS